MNAIGRDVARYPYHMENGLINTFRCDTEVCGPLCPSVEIASTTCLKLATLVNFGHIGFGKFYSDFLLLFRNQTLVNCTSLDSLSV